MVEHRYDPAENGVHPRTVFVLTVLIVAAGVAGIWWLIFIGDPVQFEKPDCRATIESAQDIIVKGCLDWGAVANTLFAISAYAAILLGLPAMACGRRGNEKPAHAEEGLSLSKARLEARNSPSRRAFDALRLLSPSSG